MSLDSVATLVSTDTLRGTVLVVTYRSLEARDVGPINRLYFDEYGLAYPYPLRSVCEDGVCIVAEFGGEVVAYAQAVPYAHYPRVWELGRLIVRPDCRQHHVARRLTEIRLRGVHARHAAMVMSENVCYRPDCASQWNLVKNFGFVLCGIQPCRYPCIQREYLGDQPESVLVAAKLLRPDEGAGFGRRRVFLPGDMPDILRTFLPRYVYERGFQALVYGDMPNHIEHKGHRVEGGVGSSLVDIPINWPDAEAVVMAYIAAGYRLSAILPGFGMTEAGAVYDLVRLFKPPEGMHFIDFDRIHVAEPLTRLHAFMRQEYEPRR